MLIFPFIYQTDAWYIHRILSHCCPQTANLGMNLMLYFFLITLKCASIYPCMGYFLKEENIYFISLKHEPSKTALKTAPMINYFILFK